MYYNLEIVAFLESVSTPLIHITVSESFDVQERKQGLVVQNLK